MPCWQTVSPTGKSLGSKKTLSYSPNSNLNRNQTSPASHTCKQHSTPKTSKTKLTEAEGYCGKRREKKYIEEVF